MSKLDIIGAPKQKALRRNYCSAYLAALMEARGFVLQVRGCDFKHEALDKLDAMLCEAMDEVIELSAELRQPGDDNGFANTVSVGTDRE